jgi:hypothetical protein
MIEVRQIVVRCAKHLFRYNLLANIGQQGERMWGTHKLGEALLYRHLS